MRNSRFALAGTLMALMTVGSTWIAGQAPKAAPQQKAATSGTTKGWAPPKTAWGDPDLQGIWRDTTSGMPLERPRQFGERNVLTDEELAARQKAAQQRSDDLVNGEIESTDPGGLPSYNSVWLATGEPVRVTRQASAIIDPPNGRLPPWTAEQIKRRDAREARARGRGEGDSWEDRGVSERCLVNFTRELGGVKRFVQGPGYVAIVSEAAFRIVPLDGRPAVGSKITGWLGDARGHWEGNTLVVEITNFNDKEDGGPIMPNSRNAGGNYVGSGEKLRLTERFTPLGPNELEYQYTLTDPQTYMRPYTARYELSRDDDYLMLPTECHEGNEGLAGILASSRADEKGSLETGARFQRERERRFQELKAEWATAPK